MATRNVVLTETQSALIDRLVASGRYQNASEVMREGLRLLEQRVAEDTAKIEALRQATDRVMAAITALLREIRHDQAQLSRDEAA